MRYFEGEPVLQGARSRAGNAERNVGRQVVPVTPEGDVSPCPATVPDVLFGEQSHLFPETMRSVLIVADSPGLCLALSQALRHPRLRLRTAESSSAGLSLLARESMDFVIAERKMPSATGVDFLAAVKREFPDVTRVLLTADCDVAMIRDAIQRGGVSYFLAKPWDAYSLRELLESLLLAEWPGRVRGGTGREAVEQARGNRSGAERS